MADAPAAEPAPGWERFSAASPSGSLPTDVVRYGADIPDESSLRLLGHLEGKRVLDLGCGAGHAAVAFARQGAKVIAVDTDPHQLEQTRRSADEAGVRVELQPAAHLAELAFIQADAIDVAFSAYALVEIGDLDRVFRQVHRVLKPEGPLVFSLPHPAAAMFDPRAADPLRIVRAYHDDTPIEWERAGEPVVDHPRTVTAVFTRLLRSGFRVDAILEPPPAAGGSPSPHWSDLDRWVPPTIVYRARKQGA